MVQFIEKNEEWRTVRQNPVYLVSNYGRVKTIDHPVWCKKNQSYSVRKGILCRPSNNNSKKYWRVGIQINNRRKAFAVHRLVAEAFIPNPNNYPQINHIDGDKNNNHVSNLEWCDNAYNQRHAIEHNLKSREKMSKNCAMRKLTLDQVKFIREEYTKVDLSKRGNLAKFMREMQAKFNLKSPNTIFWIIKNGTNKYL